MQPRLKSSKKWAEFPQEYQDQIHQAFLENFGPQIGKAKLFIEGRIYPQEILLRVGLSSPGHLAQSGFEVSMDYKPENAVQSIHHCVDAAASMMLEHFEEKEKVDFPRIWTAFPFQGKTVYLQYSTENSELDAAADKILGLADESLVKEGAEDEIEETDSGNEDA